MLAMHGLIAGGKADPNAATSPLPPSRQPGEQCCGWIAPRCPAPRGAAINTRSPGNPRFPHTALPAAGKCWHQAPGQADSDALYAQGSPSAVWSGCRLARWIAASSRPVRFERHGAGPRSLAVWSTACWSMDSMSLVPCRILAGHTIRNHPYTKIRISIKMVRSGTLAARAVASSPWTLNGGSGREGRYLPDPLIA